MKASPAWANVIIPVLWSELETGPCCPSVVSEAVRGAESKERKDRRPDRLLPSVSLVPHILEYFDRAEEALEVDDIELLVVLKVFLLTILSDRHKREGVKLRPDEPVSGPLIELHAIACCAKYELPSDESDEKVGRLDRREWVESTTEGDRGLDSLLLYLEFGC